VITLRERVSVAEQERASAEDKLQSAQRTAHQSSRSLEETTAKARQEELKANALTERVDELAKQLDHAEQVRAWGRCLGKRVEALGAVVVRYMPVCRLASSASLSTNVAALVPPRVPIMCLHRSVRGCRRS
jgi:DNA-binding transcriptional regulator GbsR (MarR family)